MGKTVSAEQINRVFKSGYRTGTARFAMMVSWIDAAVIEDFWS